MCWGLHIMDGDKVVQEINTQGEACEFFKHPNVRYQDAEDFPPGHKRWPAPEDAECCLCPVDIDYLLEQTGYVRIGHNDPRWDCMDTRIEKK